MVTCCHGDTLPWRRVAIVTRHLSDTLNDSRHRPFVLWLANVMWLSISLLSSGLSVNKREPPSKKRWRRDFFDTSHKSFILHNIFGSLVLRPAVFSFHGIIMMVWGALNFLIESIHIQTHKQDETCFHQKNVFPKPSDRYPRGLSLILSIRKKKWTLNHKGKKKPDI